MTHTQSKERTLEQKNLVKVGLKTPDLKLTLDWFAPGAHTC